MANYFLKAATPCSCQRVSYFAPTTITLETWREIGKYDVSEIVQKSWKDHRFVFNETSIIEQIVETSKKKLELKAARVVLIKRIHACQLT